MVANGARRVRPMAHALLRMARYARWRNHYAQTTHATARCVCASAHAMMRSKMSESAPCCLPMFRYGAHAIYASAHTRDGAQPRRASVRAPLTAAPRFIHRPAVRRPRCARARAHARKMLFFTT